MADRDAHAIVIPAAAHVGRENQGTAISAEFCDEGVVPPAGESCLEGVRSRRKVCRVCTACQINGAGVIHRDATAVRVGKKAPGTGASAQVAGVYQPGTCGIQLRDKGTSTVTI